MKISWGKRQWLEFLVVVVIALGIVWLGYSLGYLPKYSKAQSHEMFGVLETVVNDSQLAVSGIHLPDAYSINPQKLFNQQPHLRFKVLIDNQTKLVKIVSVIPYTKEQAKKGPIRFDPNKVKKVEKAGSLDDLKKSSGLLISVKTADNSINQSDLKATQITYEMFDYVNND